MIPLPPIWVVDTECYVDYYLVMLRNIYTGEVQHLELTPEMALPQYPFDRYTFPYKLRELLSNKQLVSFNGNNYDIPTLSLACAGNSLATLKAASDDIILNGLKPWHVSDKYGCEILELDHIDLIEVAPGIAGLKIYGGRLHSQRLQDLPIDPGANIAPAQREILRLYCGNDLLTTMDLYFKLKPQIDLRIEMSREFGMDLRSKSDAQIAEAVIRSEVQKIIGRRVYRPEIHPDYSFKYRVPDFVHFSAPGMHQVMEIIRNATFTLNEEGSVELPAILASCRIRIGNGVYRMGIGGLHSSETCSRHLADDYVFLKDRDVTSYYPRIIINQGMFPPHLTEAFLQVYEGIVDRRIAAKVAGDKVTESSLKIVINGSFGKLGSKWSILYSPDLLIQTTLTGQLSLLMLIEFLELSGFQVVSANTDGIVIKGAKARTEEMNAVIAAWEVVTGFATEETEYTALYSKDVNNYIAIKPDGSAKLKGLYAPAGMQKNVTNEICVEAVIAKLVNGTPIDHTITGCDDVRKFITIRQVKGGAKYDEQYLGKAVRWYYRSGETRSIHYATNNNKVARSNGAFPLMELPPNLPADIDYQWYIKEAESILADVGGDVI